MKNIKSMKNEILFDKIGFVDDALIEEAATYVGRPQAKKSRFRFNYVYSSLAAMCAVMLVLTGVLVYIYNTQPPIEDEPSVADTVPEIGDIIQFGEFDWRVLDVQDGKALIIAENITAYRPYHFERADITWEHSSIRQYLNGDFYDSFSTEEQSRILETMVNNSNNFDYGTFGGNNTADRIFLLSIEEANKYFANDEARIALNANGEPRPWWLRSPSSDSVEFAAVVLHEGYIYALGFEVSEELAQAQTGVRPAMWVNIENFDNYTPPPAPMKIGDIIEMGGYNWRVIDVGLDLALIITEDVIDNRPYHSLGGSVTWENSEIREYLNGEFYENTFTDAEKMLIYESMNINRDNPEHGTLGGNDTADRIFLLSIEEANRYFTDNEARIATNAYGITVWWYLRSPGYISEVPAWVFFDGDILSSGLVDPDTGGVRPAMWVDKYFILSGGENGEETVSMPSQSYLGTWYTEDNPPDDLTITLIDDNKIEFSLSVFRTVGTNGTAEIEGSQIIFNTDVGIRGTMQFYKGGVFMTVTESDFTYINAEATWYFTLREYEVVKPTPISFSLTDRELTFTAESKVRDFRYLSIGGYVYEGEVRYLIREILHSFDEFTPDNPIVISRIDLGSAFAAQGFSYMDDSGITRFFTLHGAMANWDPPVHAAEVGYMHFAFPETFEYLGETYSIQDADDIYYYEGRIGDVTFDSFGYIRTAGGVMKVTLGQEIDGFVITRADATFAVDYNGELLLTDTEVILEGNIELTGRLYKVTNSIAEPSGFHITEVQAPSGIIPFGTGSFDTDYSQFFVWGDYDPEDEYPNIFAEADYAEVRATFSSVRLRVTSRSTGGNYIELTGITEIIN